MGRRRSSDFTRGSLEEALSLTTFAVQTQQIAQLSEQLAFKERDLKITEALAKHTASMHERKFSKQEEEKKTLLVKSETDHLTKALNRNGWHREFNDLKEQSAKGLLVGKVVGVILADLDHFKDYNDTFGHAEGDKALQDYFQALRDVVKEGDVLGRYGGEEAIIIVVANELNLQKLGQRYVDAVANYPDRRGRQITASFGLTLWPGETFYNLNVEKDIIPPTDAALYKAKEQGRNRAVVDKKTGFTKNMDRSRSVDRSPQPALS